MNYSDNITNKPSCQKTLGESTSNFIYRVCCLKSELGFSWEQIKDICNEQLKISHSESYYRKGFAQGTFSPDQVSDDENDSSIESNVESNVDYDYLKQLSEQLNAMKEEKFKIRKERQAMNKSLQNMYAKDIYRELAEEVVQELKDARPFLTYVSKDKPDKVRVSDNKAIVCIGDWHYGIEVDNFHNTFNRETCRKRIAKLFTEICETCELYKVSEICLVNLGDLVAGRIHPSISMDCTEGVVRQTLEVTDLLYQFILALKNRGFKIDYYWCLDNHSRVEPDKEKSRKDENLVYFTTHYLEGMFASEKDVTIHNNIYGDDIISFECNGWKIAGCHGDLDKSSKAVTNITMFTRDNYDLLLAAHMHHFGADEVNKCVMLMNSSVMSTDSYAADLRLSAEPSQNIVIVSKDNVTKAICRVKLTD